MNLIVHDSVFTSRTKCLKILQIMIIEHVNQGILGSNLCFSLVHHGLGGLPLLLSRHLNLNLICFSVSKNQMRTISLPAYWVRGDDVTAIPSGMDTI